MVSANADYEIAEYGGVAALIVKKWSKECENSLREKQRLVVLNQARGWNPGSLSFLEGLEIEGLTILAHTPLDGLDSVLRIRSLSSLSLNCEPNSALELGDLEGLNSCWLSWSAHYQSVFRLRSLKKLGISDLPFFDFSNLQEMQQLEELTIKGGKLVSLRGIDAVSATLRHLELSALRRLDSIGGLEQLNGLQSLVIDGSRKVTSIAPIQELTRLAFLTLSDLGELESLSPIGNLEELEKLVFAESTNIVDGDLSMLATLPKLRDVVFQPRRHYSHINLLGLTRPIRKPWKRR